MFSWEVLKWQSIQFHKQKVTYRLNLQSTALLSVGLIHETEPPFTFSTGNRQSDMTRTPWWSLQQSCQTLPSFPAMSQLPWRSEHLPFVSHRTGVTWLVHLDSLSYLSARHVHQQCQGHFLSPVGMQGTQTVRRTEKPSGGDIPPSPPLIRAL